MARPRMTDADRRRLVSTLALLGSDVPGERDAAALAASRIAARLGGWDALVVSRDPLLDAIAWARPQTPTQRGEVTPQAEAGELLKRHAALREETPLSPGDVQFLQAIAAWKRGISPKQAKWLADIRYRLGFAETYAPFV